MLRGLHGMVFSSDPVATRRFLQEKFRLPSTDVGNGWLIFDLPSGDLGVHPVSDEGKPGPGTHMLSFFCDDLRGMVRGLKAEGVEFDHEITEQEWGFETSLHLPGGVEIQLFEPKYSKSRKGGASPRRRTRRA